MESSGTGDLVSSPALKVKYQWEEFANALPIATCGKTDVSNTQFALSTRFGMALTANQSHVLLAPFGMAKPAPIPLEIVLPEPIGTAAPASLHREGVLRELAGMALSV